MTSLNGKSGGPRLCLRLSRLTGYTCSKDLSLSLWDLGSTESGYIMPLMRVISFIVSLAWKLKSLAWFPGISHVFTLNVIICYCNFWEIVVFVVIEHYIGRLLVVAICETSFYLILKLNYCFWWVFFLVYSRVSSANKASIELVLTGMSLV